MPLKPIALAATLAGALTILALPATAQQTERGNEQLKKYCTGDYLSYCGEYNRNDPRLDQCFKTNWKKLSENCRRAIDAFAPGSTPSRKRG